METGRKHPILPWVILAALLGAAAGFALALHLDLHAVKLSQSPFSPDPGTRITKGRDFSGAKELDDLKAAEKAEVARGLQLAKAGETAPALQAIEPIRKKHPDFRLGQGLAALISMGMLDSTAGPKKDTGAGEGLDGESLEILRACLAKDSTHPWIQYLAGRAFEQMRRPDSAETHYRKAIDASPQFAYPYIALGRLQLDKGELRDANLNFRMAIGLMESAPEDYLPGSRLAIPVTETLPYDLLAALFLQSGAEDSAAMALEYGQEQGVKTDRMQLVQGRLWEARGFLSKADSLYRALQARDPGNPAYAEALATLGWKPQGMAASTGARPADAEAAFAIALLDPLARQNTRNAPLWMALGQAYYRRGLFGMATECFDSSLKYESALPGLSEKRDAAYQALIRQTVPAAAQKARNKPQPPSLEEQAPVVIPGSNALLGTYSVPWGSTQTQVRQAYPKKDFHTLANGNLMDSFVQEGVRHDYLLAFRQGKLWGIRVYVTDSAGVSGDLFGRIIRTKAKISGEGRGTGEAKCTGFKSFQGAIWENDDTFEFMAQFEGDIHRVRLARLAREYLPEDRRLCELVTYLREDAWK
ncbi:MAG: hypothetical protein ABI036_17060 [Fibrobacteria bacterium]